MNDKGTRAPEMNVGVSVGTQKGSDEGSHSGGDGSGLEENRGESGLKEHGRPLSQWMT